MANPASALGEAFGKSIEMELQRSFVKSSSRSGSLSTSAVKEQASAQAKSCYW